MAVDSRAAASYETVAITLGVIAREACPRAGGERAIQYTPAQALQPQRWRLLDARLRGA